jgi:hypothetical protein
MRRFLLIALLLSLAGCSGLNLEKDSTEVLSGMVDPIVVFAESDNTIILLDKFGDMLLLDEDDKAGPAIMKSYNFGDTLITVKK